MFLKKKDLVIFEIVWKQSLKERKLMGGLICNLYRGMLKWILFQISLFSDEGDGGWKNFFLRDGKKIFVFMEWL